MTTRRVLLPRVERAAVLLLETCDYEVSTALAAVLLAAEAYARAEIIAPRCAVCRGVREAITKATTIH